MTGSGDDPVKLIQSHEVLDLVASIHEREEDLSEGDLAHRLDKFTHYVVGAIPLSDIDLSEWGVDDERIMEFADLPSETRPPIVFDAVDRSIIDGIHRSNAAAKRGEVQIAALIGLEEHLNPDWTEDLDSEDLEDEDLADDGDEPPAPRLG
jgi:hypothetical protein